MLTKRRCTATGVINFFARHEPHIAVGTVIPRSQPVHYVWHFHGETGPAAGLARDWQTAERAINERFREARQAEDDDRRAA
jgi:hypothetical protein